jgi:hypothetical protein
MQKSTYIVTAYLAPGNKVKTVARGIKATSAHQAAEKFIYKHFPQGAVLEGRFEGFMSWSFPILNCGQRAYVEKTGE